MQPMSMAPVTPLASLEQRSRTKQEIAEQDVFDEIERQVGARNFEHWFRGKTTLTITEGELAVGVSSAFLLNWMQKHFRGAIAAAAETVLGSGTTVRFEVDQRVSFRPSANPEGPSAETKNGSRSSAGLQPAQDATVRIVAGSPSLGQPSDALQIVAAESLEGSQGPTVEPSLSLSTKSHTVGGRRFADLTDFVSGPCNELASMAAHQVCDAPGARFNPLYLHGNPGLGKTHLLEGIYRGVRRRHPNLQVLYLTAESFANHFTQALREHKLPGFRQRFRNVDVLLVDDIDFFDGKRAIQEEFLHTFQQLESHGRQVVVAADRHPKLLTKVTDDLTTRFVSGLVCKLEAPDFDTRLKIVEKKMAGRSSSVAPEALQYVAHRFRNNVRELEGALHCLETYHAFTRQRITQTSARKLLADLERDSVRTVRIPDVEQTVCKVFGVEPRDLRSSRRMRTFSQPRMLAMYLIRKHTHAAYSEIGEHFGGRNHSTVIAAEKRVREMLDAGEAMRIASRTWKLDELIDVIEQQLQAG